MQHHVSWSGVFLVLINFTFPRPSQPICVCVPSHFPYTIFIHIILFIIYNIYYYTNTQILQYMCSWPSVRWACSTSVLSSSDDFVTTTTQPGPICISCHTIFNCFCRHRHSAAYIRHCRSNVFRLCPWALIVVKYVHTIQERQKMFSIYIAHTVFTSYVLYIFYTVHCTTYTRDHIRGAYGVWWAEHTECWNQFLYHRLSCTGIGRLAGMAHYIVVCVCVEVCQSKSVGMPQNNESTTMLDF